MASLDRRGFLALAGRAALLGGASIAGAGVLGACSPTGFYPSSLHGSSGAMVPSRRPLPASYTQPMTTPPVIDAVPRPGVRGPIRRALAIRETELEVIPGTRTQMLTYGDSYPGPTILARAGAEVQLDVTNNLSVNQVVHLHGGVTAPGDDGYPTDHIAPGATRRYRYPLQQAAAPLWYHDHVADFTGPNVYAGLAGAFVVTDPDEDRFSLPDGDRDLPVVIADRSFGEDAELLYPGVQMGDPAAHNSSGVHGPTGHVPDAMGRVAGVQLPYLGGVLGDVMLVNGTPWPVAEVAAGPYRLRVLNGCNARRLELRFSGDVTVVQVGTDLSLLPAPAELSTVVLAPGERADLVVDFSRVPVDGRVEVTNGLATGSAGQVMQFVVTRPDTQTLELPDVFGSPGSSAEGRPLAGTESMPGAFGVPLPDRHREVDVTRGMHFALGRRSSWWNVLDPGPEEWSINGMAWRDDTDLFTARLGTWEKWRISSTELHPVHAHLLHMAVPGPRARSGAAQLMWKDTLDLQPGQGIEALVPVAGFAGRYVMHCHNLEHEDHMMMVPFSVTD